MNFRYRSNAAQMKARFASIRTIMAKAATGAMNDVSVYIKREGRAAIANAGFKSKWQNALQVKVYPEKTVSIGPAAVAKHKIPYAGVFETGARISGSPYLWLPIGNIPNKLAGKKLTPKQFEASIGPLRKIERSATGKPPLLVAFMRANSPAARPTLARLRAGGALARLGVRSRRGGFGGQGLVMVPIFIGITSVQMHKLFDLHAVFNKARDQLPAFYAQNLARVR